MTPIRMPMKNSDGVQGPNWPALLPSILLLPSREMEVATPSESMMKMARTTHNRKVFLGLHDHEIFTSVQTSNDGAIANRYFQLMIEVRA